MAHNIMSQKRAASSGDGRGGAGDSGSDGDDDDDDGGGGSSSSDDDFGPSLGNDAAAAASSSSAAGSKSTKKLKKLKKIKKANPHEQFYLDNLPSTDFYEKSYMNKAVISHIVISKPTEYIITACRDGLVYFWKKMLTGVEFVKKMQAHLACIHSLVLSGDGLKLATSSLDKTVKFYDVSGFDLVNFIEVAFVPTRASSMHPPPPPPVCGSTMRVDPYLYLSYLQLPRHLLRLNRSFTSTFLDQAP